VTLYFLASSSARSWALLLVCFSNREANTGSSASNDRGLALEGETLQDRTTIDYAIVIVDKVASVERVKIRHGEDWFVKLRKEWREKSVSKNPNREGQL
jgi:hypothetical protein